MPDLSSSLKPSFTMRSYCFLVAAASGRFRPCSLPSLRAMPESFAACAAGEVTGVFAVLHVLAVGLEDAGVGAGLGEDFAQHGEVDSSAAPKPSLRPGRRC